MGKHNSTPPPPDPNVVAAAQTRVNQDTAAYNAALNRINTNTPFGSQSYRVVGTDPSGAPIYEQNISLSPENQQIYSQQLGQNVGLTGAAGSRVNEIQNQSPFSLSGLPERGQINSANLPGLPTDISALRKNSQDALYALNAEYLDPQFQRDESALRSRLANQGIVEGSEAFTNAMNDFNRGKETAYRQARNQAIAGGGEEAQRSFDMASNARGQLYGEQLTGANFANSTRAQALNEEQTARGMPLQELAAIRGLSQPDMPQFQGMSPGSTAPADITSAINNAYQGQVNASNAKTQQQNANMQAIASIAAAFLLSDERAKEDIEQIGELNDGTGLFSYRYKGDSTPQIGVIAQEVEKTNPKAVKEIGGLKHVNYRQVLARALEAGHA